MPHVIGRQRYQLYVIENSAREYLGISVNMVVVHKEYFRFPDLNAQGILDLGYCYITAYRQFSKVMPLRIENVSDHTCYFSVKSNLEKQVFIFHQIKF